MMFGRGHYECGTGPTLDALPPVSFEQNTVLGTQLMDRWAHEPFDDWDISQRDPTIRSEQNLFGDRFVGSSLSGF
jgi:hypothetical protein